MIKKVKLGSLKIESRIFHINHKNLYKEYEDSKREGSTNEYWPKLKKQLENGYLSNSICIGKTGWVLGGRHRTVILKDMYDDDFELLVDESGWFPTCLSHFFTLGNVVGGRRELSYKDDFVIKEVSLGELYSKRDTRNLNTVHKNKFRYFFRNLIPKVLLSVTYWDDLQSSLDNNGYAPGTFTGKWKDGNDYIQINQHNKILDGHARVCLLIRKHGNNFKIKVRVREESPGKRINVKLFISLLILITIIILIFN